MPAIEQLVTAAPGLAEQARAATDTTERERRISGELVEAMTDAGVFAALLPAGLGGVEANVGTALGVVETLAQGDGSAAWSAMIGMTSAVVAAYLPQSEAETVYGTTGRVISGGVFAPQARAKVDGGVYRVSGRWSFASGCQHCDWLMGGCVVEEADGSLRAFSDGMPDARMVLFPAAQARVHDTWSVSGLCGTGSHDIEVDGIEVPVARSVSLITDEPHQPGPLYKFPVFGLLALGVASVATGIARGAIDELLELAATKRPTGTARRLLDRSAAQTEIARAEAELSAGRALVTETVAEAWQEAETMVGSGGRLPVVTRARLRLAATNATWAASSAVDRMYNLGGGSSVYRTSGLQRRFRDVHTATQHVMVQQSTFELAGRVLAGVEADTRML